MNILFINSDASTHEELNEFSLDNNLTNYYSNRLENSIIILNEHPITTVVLKMNKLSDVSILKYLNDYYKNIKVLISAPKYFKEVLTIFSQVSYEYIGSPMGLSELKSQLMDSAISLE